MNTQSKRAFRPTVGENRLESREVLSGMGHLAAMRASLAHHAHFAQSRTPVTPNGGATNPFNQFIFGNLSDPSSLEVVRGAFGSPGVVFGSGNNPIGLTGTGPNTSITSGPGNNVFFGPANTWVIAR